MRINIFEKVKYSIPFHYRKEQGMCLLVTLLLCYFVTLSCSNIDESERLIYVPPVEVQRAVLIEDFTGQACVNCPTATAQIHELQQTYGEDNIIAVAIHSGPFAHRRSNMSNDFLSDLGTVQGDEYYLHWGIEAQPGVKINRGAPIYDTRQYAALISEEMKKTSPEYIASIQATINTSEHNSSLEESDFISVDVVPSAIDMPTDTRLQVWMIEDSINVEGGNRNYVQLLPNNASDYNYVHNHVFRASLTQDPYGDYLNTHQTSYSYTLSIPNYWNKNQLSIVVFLWNNTDGVIEVKKTKIINN